jgi:hypothetical protein
MSYGDWEIESATNDRVVFRRKTVGGGAILFLVILYAIYNFIVENWVYIVIVLGIAVVCVITCLIIYANANKPGLKIFLAILTSISLIIGVLCFGPRIQNGVVPAKNQKPASTTTQQISYAYVNSDALNVRSGPSADYSIVARLQKNVMVQIISNSGDWRRIISGNIDGYVNSKFLRY